MRIILAQTAGFCQGVRAACQKAMEAAREHGAVYSGGPLIHNELAVRLLELHNVRSGAPGPDDPALIRAHGLPPEAVAKLAESGRVVVDATCPKVKAGQHRAARAAKAGMPVVMAGDPGHAEVLAVGGCAQAGFHVVSSLDDARAIDIHGPFLLLSQTTFSRDEFERIADFLKSRFPDCQTVMSICNATIDRQEETRRLAEIADALIVVGGKDSANTRRLADIGKALGKPTFSVVSSADLRREDFLGVEVAAVTAGASTPGWVTQGVVDRLRDFQSNSFRLVLRNGARFLTQSRILAALGAVGFSLAAQQAAGLPQWRLSIAVMAGLYVFFAHILNRRVPADREMTRLAAVDEFYLNHRRILLTAAWLAAAVALILAVREGWPVFCLAAAACIAALLHSSPALRYYGFPRRGRHFPVSRDILVAAAWTAMTAGPVALGTTVAPGWRLPAAFLCIFSLVFAGAVAQDLRDIEGDRLLGMETLAVWIGAKRAEGVAMAGLAVAGLFTVLAGWPLALAATTVYGILCLRLTATGAIRDYVACRALIDGTGIVAGLCAAAGTIA